MSEILFSMDVEDPDEARDGSFVPPLLAVLDWLAAEHRLGTFFVVGELAEKYPDAVRRIASAGHEVALHGWQHTPLEHLGQSRFVRQTTRGKALLEDLTGKPVHGYRAPMFSLTEKTPWADEHLFDLGFQYSSSVLPARNPRFHYDGVPQKLFHWPSGLVELPAPVSSLMGFAMPFLGGIYFRYLPNILLRAMNRRLDETQVRWFYCHPYDFYWDKAYIKMKDTPLWVNLLLMGRRRHAMKKMHALFKDHDTHRTFSEYVSDRID